MVEAVFRQFKQKIYTRTSKNDQSLYSTLYGETPIEVFNNEFVKEKYKQTVKVELMARREERKLEFSKCNKCSRKYLRSLAVTT